MTAPPPGSFFRRHDPREPDAVRIENRSDRVWVYGFVRLVPGVLFLGGIIGMWILVNYARPLPLAVAFLAGIAVVAVPFALDRSTLLDPVDYVLLGKEWLHVKRLAGRRNFLIRDVRRIEFMRPPGEDYDERQKIRRYVEVTIRLPGIRLPARLLVSARESGLVMKWATARTVDIREFTTNPD
jgi:hypothetical protein